MVTKLDRLARSLLDARAIADELTARQISLSLGGSVYDPTDAVGRLLFNVLAIVAEFESDLIRLRTRGYEGRKADPAPRPLLPHAVVRRPSAARPYVQAHRDGGPTNETNGQGLCESCTPAKQAAGWHSRIRPGRRHEMETTTPAGPAGHPGRPHLPIPSPRNLASNAFTGHDRLGLVFGALLRFAA